MSRIRTIKPEFFQHEGLYAAEAESGLPLRLSFAGLWCQCDREGRFAWRPARLKLNILPWDDVDFSRVLDALATRGFVVRYASEGVEYGMIPSWRRHQVINNRERASETPEPSEINDLPTRQPRVNDACGTRLGNVQGEGKGREGKERGTRDAWKPPSLEEVAAYIAERGSSVDAARFVDFYTAKGWLVGKAKMRDWRAAVRTWERREPVQEAPAWR